MTTLIIVWTMAIWPPSLRWAVGQGGSIHHRHTGWDSLAGLLMGSGRPGIRSLRRLGRGGCLAFCHWVVLLLDRPVILSLDGWGVKSVLGCVQFNGVIHRIMHPLRSRCHLVLLLLFESLVKCRPRFREPISTQVTWRFPCTERQSLVEMTLLTAMMIVTATPIVRATRELELRLLQRRPVTWFHPAAHRSRKRSQFCLFWNFAWDRLASRMHAATATTFLMRITHSNQYNTPLKW